MSRAAFDSENVRRLVHRYCQPDERAWKDFEKRLHIRRLGRGEAFVALGQVPGALGYLTEGVMRRFANHDGSERVEALLRPGSFVSSFGALLTQRPSEVAIDAVTDVRLLQVPIGDLEHLARVHTCWSQFAMLAGARLVSQAEARHRAFRCTDASARLSALIAEWPDVFRQVPKHQVASYLGISPERLSRILAATKGNDAPLE